MNKDHYIEIKTCRYCLDDEVSTNLIIPCRCKGSCAYVHKDCLKEWLKKNSDRNFLIGRPINDKCEICKTRYNIASKKSVSDRKAMTLEIILNIIYISVVLFLLYIISGNALYNFHQTRNLFVQVENKWGSVMLNGLILTHLILGFIFFICFLCGYRRDADCCFISFYCLGTNSNSNDRNSGAILILILFVITAFIFILIIYIDVIYSIIQKYTIHASEIDILPFVGEK